MRNQSWKHWLWSYYCPTLGRGVWLVLEVNWVLCRNSLPMSKVSTQTSGREDAAFAQISKNNRISLIVRHSGETRRKTSWYASGYPEKLFCCGFFISLPLNPPCQCLSMQDAPYPQPACSPSRRKRLCAPLTIPGQTPTRSLLRSYPRFFQCAGVSPAPVANCRQALGTACALMKSRCWPAGLCQET